MKKIQEKRIWSKVKKIPKGCWIWTAGLFSNGYGSVSINDHTYKVSRVIYELVHGKIKKGLLVLHECDNRKCVKPDHLFLGTHKENMQDMTKKGRQAKGENCGPSKLKPRDIYEIRSLRAKGFFHWQIAKKFKVDRALIGRILNGKNWKHIK